MLRLRLATLLSAALLLSACSDGAEAPGGGATTGECGAEICTQPTGVCAEGFLEVPGIGCEPLLPAAPCPTGTRPAIGSDACVPVGVTACPQGFAPDPVGWGCTEIMPAASCSGATREVLGESSCQPVGDCDAPFPPADATLFVSAAYGPEDLDPTHFATIADALAVVGPGDVVAVDAGVYTESLLIDQPGVALIGRCAAEVVIDGGVDGFQGLVIGGTDDVIVRGITVTGFDNAILLDNAAAVIEDVVVDGNRWVGIGSVWQGANLTLRRSVIRNTTRGKKIAGPTHGLLAGRYGSATVEDSVIADNLYAGLVSDEGGHLTVTRSIVRGTRPEPDGPDAGAAGYGVIVKGSEATVVESALVDNHSAGLGVTSAFEGVYARATITRSVVGRTALSELGAGRAAEAADGAELVIEDSTLLLGEELQLLVQSPGTELRISDSVVRGPMLDDGGASSGPGLVVADGASAEIAGSAFVGNRTLGLYVQTGSAATLHGSLIQGTLSSNGGNRFGDAQFGLGAAVLPGSRLDVVDSALLQNREMSVFVRGAGAAVTFDRVLVADTVFDAGDRYGRGVNVQDGASLNAVQSAILRSTELGLVSFGSSVLLEDCTIGHTVRGDAEVLAIGVAAALGGRIGVTRSTVTGNQDIGFIVAGAAAYVDEGFVSNNAIGAHVQDGSSLVVAEAETGDALACVFSPDTSFVGNATRIGSGQIPMPAPVAAAPQE